MCSKADAVTSCVFRWLLNGFVYSLIISCFVATSLFGPQRTLADEECCAEPDCGIVGELDGQLIGCDGLDQSIIMPSVCSNSDGTSTARHFDGFEYDPGLVDGDKWVSCENQQQFELASPDTVVSYGWDISGDATLTGQDGPQVSYHVDRPGYFTVRLTADDEGCCDDGGCCKCADDPELVASLTYRSICTTGDINAPAKLCPGEVKSASVEFECGAPNSDDVWEPQGGLIVFDKGRDGNVFTCKIRAPKNSSSKTVYLKANHPDGGCSSDPKPIEIAGGGGDNNPSDGGNEGGNGGCGTGGCGGNGIGDADAVNMGSVDVRLGLGMLPSGNSAGFLNLRAERDRFGICKRGYMRYMNGREDIDVYYDFRGLRQVFTGAYLVDIVDLAFNDPADGDKYEVRYYRADDLQTGQTCPPYALSSGAVPFRTWQFHNPGAPDTDSEFIIKKHVADATGTLQLQNEYRYLYTEMADNHWRWKLWTKDESGNVLRSELMEVEETNPASHEWTKIYRSGGTTTNYRTVTETSVININGELITQRAVTPADSQSDLVTTYDYHSDGKLAIVTRPDGSWAAYTYAEVNDQDDNLVSSTTTEIEGIGDTAAPSDIASIPVYNATGVRATVTSYLYTAWSPDMGRPQTIQEYVDGHATITTSYAYAYETGPGSEYCRRTTETRSDGTESFVTVTAVDLNNADRPVYSIQPDGRYTRYIYEWGTISGDVTSGTLQFAVDTTSRSHKRTRVLRGVWDDSTSTATYVTGKSTEDHTIRDAAGNAIFEETYVSTDGSAPSVRVSWIGRVYDDSGRETDVYYSNGEHGATDWSDISCCREKAVTSPSGVQTLFEYDALGRLSSRTKLGLTSAASPQNEDILTSYTYSFDNNAFGDWERVASETLASSITGISLQSWTYYDAAGRVVRKVDAAGLTTEYLYETTSSGGNKVTATEPSGATRITEYYRDGRVKADYGTAVVPRAYKYEVNSDGTETTTVLLGTSDPQAVNWPRWSKTTYDLFGRQPSTEQPGFGGTTSTTTSHYNADGRLERTTATGMADTLYEYDALGNQSASGLDVNGNGHLSSSGTDRLSLTDSYYVLDDSNWWYETKTTTYVDTDSTMKIVAKQRQRLTGFTGSITQESHTYTEYIRGSAVETSEQTATTSLDSSTATVTRTTTVPGASNVAVSVTQNGLLTSATSISGITTIYGYDALGRRITVTDGRGNNTTTHYDSTTGRVDWVKNGNDDQTTYDYEPTTGRLSRVGAERDDGLFNYTYYSYNDRGQVEKVWGEAALPVWTEYDSFGRREALHTYREDDDFTQETWPQGDVTTWQYDPATGLLVSKTDAQTEAVTYTYTPSGQLETRTWARTEDSSALVTTYGYDPNTGELVSVDYSNTETVPDISYTYRRSGELLSVTNADPNATDHEFDYAMWPIYVTEDITGLYTRSITRRYDPANGNRFRSMYEGVAGAYYWLANGYDETTGRLTSITGNGLPSGGAHYDYLTTTTGVPAADKVSSLEFKTDTDIVLARTVRSWEPNRNLIDTVTNTWDPNVANTLVSSYDYTNDTLSRRTGVSYSGQAFGTAFTQSFGYNDRNELTGSTRSDSGTWNYDYDNIGNRVTSTTDGTVTDYVPNSLNQYLRRGETEGLRYDEDGNLLAMVEATDLNNDGHVDEDDFDLMETLIGGPTVSAAAAMMSMPMSAPSMAFQTEAVALSESEVAEAAEPVIEWTEEEANMTLSFVPVGGTQAVRMLRANTAYEVHYTTDASLINAFYLQATAQYSSTVPSGVVAPTVGDWAEVEIWDVRPLDDGLAAVGFWWSPQDVASDSGPLCTITTGDPGDVEFLVFVDWTDPENHHTITAHQRITMMVRPGQGHGHTADDTNTNGVSDASSNSVPNADTNGLDDTGTNGVPEASTNGLVQAGSSPQPGIISPFAAFLLSLIGTYPTDLSLADLDKDGDADLADFALFQKWFASQGGTRFTWNIENRLTAVEPLVPSTGDRKVEYAYDHMGRKVRRQVYDWNTGTETWTGPTVDAKYVYDGWRVIMELDGLNSDAITRTYTWGLDLSGTEEGAGGIGGLLATKDFGGTPLLSGDDETYIYTYDANGNVGQVLETTGDTTTLNLAAHYGYSPYGQRINAVSASEYDQPYRFSTKPFDDATGLGYWGYRHYDPELGRWMSRDPIGEAGGVNLYCYVGGRPNSRIDARGESFWTAAACVLCIGSIAADVGGGAAGCASGCLQYAGGPGLSKSKCIMDCCLLYLEDRMDHSRAYNIYKSVVQGGSCAACGIMIVKDKLKPPVPPTPLPAPRTTPPTTPTPPIEEEGSCKCPPCPPANPPKIDFTPGQHGCKQNQGHWHRFEQHQAPYPDCRCRQVRKFGGCFDLDTQDIYPGKPK